MPARARNMSPIVPRASVAGRALVAVVAIMTFLASVTTGVVLLVSASATEWQSEVASEITIQVRPVAGRDIEHDVSRGSQRDARAAGHPRRQAVHQGRIRQAAGAVARQRSVARRSAGAAHDRGAGRAGDQARSRRTSQPCHATGAVGQRGRPSRLDRPDAIDDRRDGIRRNRHPRAGHHCDHHFGIVRHPRRDGGQSPDRRGAAFRRRGRSLHRQSLPAAFPAARAARAA